MATFDENPKLKKAREKLLDLFAGKNRGELVNHEEIEKLIGMKRGESKYYALVRQAGLKHQEAHGVSVINEPMLGYLMATHQQQLGLLGVRTKRAKRQISRGTNSVDALPDDELSDHQRRLKSASIDSGKNTMDLLRRDAALQAYLMRSKPGDPLKIRMMEKETESA